MARRPIGIDDLWRLERIGAISAAPDGARCVVATTRYSKP